MWKCEEFSRGTRALCESLKSASENGATVIVFGGLSSSAVDRFVEDGPEDASLIICRSDGVSRALLEGRSLPGVVELADTSMVDTQ